MNRLLMIGGAKGVGKTSLTTKVSLDYNISRIETGNLLREYLNENPGIEFSDYITRRLIACSGEIILDTHFAEYPPRTTESVDFKRGLTKENLYDLSKVFDIGLCLVELDVLNLIKRRSNDTKKRVTLHEIITEELEYNKRAVTLYSQELKKPVFVLDNLDFYESQLNLINWINQTKNQDNHASK